MHRRQFLTKCAAVGLLLRRPRDLFADDSIGIQRDGLSVLRQAVNYLWDAQHSDGGWHSRTYAVLRSGQSLTPFVLSTILPAEAQMITRRDEPVERGLGFLQSHIHDDGSVGTDDPEFLEYPVHSVAASIDCLLTMEHDRDDTWIGRMVDYLLAAQYQTDNGFPPDQVAHGAWGFAPPRFPGRADHIDISHTRMVLQALRAVSSAKIGIGVSDEIFERARVFLRLLQRCEDEQRAHPQPVDWPDDAPPWDGRARSFDGGFYFSPIVLTANKGSWDTNPTHWRSYATATCDGILALLAAGVSQRDTRVQAAKSWLMTHARMDYPEGIPTDHPDSWGRAIQYYHMAARCECYQAIQHSGPWRRDAIAWLRERQSTDGSFQNQDSHLMKEDDPILCTALSVRALTAVLK